MAKTTVKMLVRREASGLARAFVALMSAGLLAGCSGGEETGEGLSAQERAEMEARMEARLTKDREEAEAELARTLGLGERPLADASGETLTVLHDLAERHGDRARTASSTLSDPEASLADAEAEDLFELGEASAEAQVIGNGVRAEMLRRARAAEEQGEPPYSAYSSPGEDLDAGGWERFVEKEIATDLARVPEPVLREWLAEERAGEGYGADAMNLVRANVMADGFGDDWRVNLEEEALEKADGAVKVARAAYVEGIEDELDRRSERADAGGEPS